MSGCCANCVEESAEWLEKKGYTLIIAFIVVQVVIYVSFTVLFCLSDNKLTVDFIVYLTLILALFMAYMIHFAVHSVNLKQLQVRLKNFI